MAAEDGDDQEADDSAAQQNTADINEEHAVQQQAPADDGVAPGLLPLPRSDGAWVTIRSGFPGLVLFFGLLSGRPSGFSKISICLSFCTTTASLILFGGRRQCSDCEHAECGGF